MTLTPLAGAARRGWLAAAVWSGFLALSVVQGLCPTPAVNLNSRVSFSQEELSENTVAKYSCDPGFTRLGEASRLCSADDTWTGKPPSCVTNVAQGKPATQSSVSRGGPASNGNDGDRSTLHDGGACTETRNETSPWWRVDLLAEYPVELIRVTTRACCGQEALQDVEIRVGSSATLQQNRLCAWFPGSLPEGQEKDFECARPMTGRYVFVQMVGKMGVLSLCEVQVFTQKEIAKEQCAPGVPLDQLSLFGRTCFQLQLTQGTNYAAARRHCQRNSGDLAHSLSDDAFSYLQRQLTEKREEMTIPRLWIGVRKVVGEDSWNWVNGEPVLRPRWGRDQPNKYGSNQNCVVLDGDRGWRWNDFNCGIDYLHWVCQYHPQVCGSPDRQLNTTIAGGDFGVDSSIEYRCPEGSRVVGDVKRSCGRDGFWSGQAPSCQHVDCGPLTAPEHGEISLSGDRTTHAARATYMCDSDYALLGPPERTCGDDGAWTEDQPQCLYAKCAEPESPAGGEMRLRGNLTVGTEALFTCSGGHRLVGEPLVTCQLGGAWTAAPPLCQLIDCGAPPAPPHGQRRLAAGTLYGASVTYSCEEDYLLEGPVRRTCEGEGQWTEQTPACLLIECGEPDIPADTSVTGYDFYVRSEVRYQCDPGFLQRGEAVRVCQHDGTWSGEPPFCKYISCGRVFALLYGDVQYPNGTALGSVLQYTCSRTYRLLGDRYRVCGVDGQWSGAAPRCEEVRCTRPEQPRNTFLNITGNDRMRQRAKQILKNLPNIETFRVGTEASYSCKPGYKVVGDQTRRCLNTAGWTGQPPSCVYVDCGQPESIPSGSVELVSRATHYGAIAGYSCEKRFRLRGGVRRSCLGNGTWSGQLPVCEEVVCDEPDKRSEVLSVTVSGYRVGDTAQYHCGAGRRLVGEGARMCREKGGWSGRSPSCTWLDCGAPPDLENGRVLLANDSTLYQSQVEHHCFPGFMRRGLFIRRCDERGQWSGPDTQCTPGMGNINAVGDDTAISGDASATAVGAGTSLAPVLPPGGESALQADADRARSITAGWTSAAVVVFLLLAGLAAGFCFWKRRELLKSQGNGAGHGLKPMEGGRPDASIPGYYSTPADVPNQGRPLPSRPGEEDIYAELDGHHDDDDDDSFDDDDGLPSGAERTYANRDATYANGLHHSATYTNGGVDQSATYTNGGARGAIYANEDSADSGVGDAESGGTSPTNVNGVKPVLVSSPDRATPVTVNGMQM